MKYSHLIGIGMVLVLTAYAGEAARADSTTGQQIVDPNDAALAAVMSNLPAGATVRSASQKQLDKAIKRTIYMNPALASSIVPSLSKVAPARTRMIKRAVAAALAPYARQNGKSGSGGGVRR